MRAKLQIIVEILQVYNKYLDLSLNCDDKRATLRTCARVDFVKDMKFV